MYALSFDMIVSKLEVIALKIGLILPILSRIISFDLVLYWNGVNSQ